MGLLIRGSCVLSYAKVERTPHLGFTLAYIALMSAMYWLLCNKWAVYCKCGLAARLCVMYSLTCIVVAVSLMYYTFTVSKVIVMRITLQVGGMSLAFTEEDFLVSIAVTCFWISTVIKDLLVQISVKLICKINYLKEDKTRKSSSWKFSIEILSPEP